MIPKILVIAYLVSIITVGGLLAVPFLSAIDNGYKCFASKFLSVIGFVLGIFILIAGLYCYPEIFTLAFGRPPNFG